MCILFIAVKQHPDYPLIIAANRDEFHARPTKEMHWWKGENLLAGKDTQAGGTWLAITNRGDISALTNYRKLPLVQGNFNSRGELPLKALRSSAAEINQHLTTEHRQYQGFNLLYGNSQGLMCFDSVKQQFTEIKSGFHSICNGSLDDIWPKMAQGEIALETYVTQNKAIEHNALLSILQNTQQAPDELLPDTGIGLDWERKLSAIKIKGPEYGTRSSCVYTQSTSGELTVTETSYDTLGQIVSTKEFNWQLAT